MVGFQTFLHNIAAVIRTGGRRLYLQKRNQLVTFAKEKQTMRNSDYRLSPEERADLRNVDVSGKEGFVPAETVLAKEVGAHGTAEREAFDAKARAWYYGEVLKERRKELGLTQKELADNVGCKRTYINRIEHGETDMQLSSFIRITDALGLSLRLEAGLV